MSDKKEMSDAGCQMLVNDKVFSDKQSKGQALNRFDYPSSSI
jgi:hypothetical protein